MLQKMREEDFDAVYSLMEISFPRDERGNYQDQKKRLNRSDYTVYLLPGNRGEIKGFITVYRLESVAFVEHFAVNPACRNQGIGSEILRELREKCSCPICLEVELPETEQARRRIGFYQRNGFYLNPYPYLQPPYSPDRNPVPLLIMTTDSPLTEDEFNGVKSLLYQKVYNVAE